VSTGQKQSEHSEKSLLGLIHSVSVAPGFREALMAVLDGAHQLVPCDGTSVMWLDGDHLEVLARTGSTAPLAGLILPASQIGAARAVLDSMRPVVIPDTTQDARWQQVPGEEQVRAWMGVPLLVKKRVLGLLEWTAQESTDWERQDVELAHQMARYVTPLLYQVQLLADTRQRLREGLHAKKATSQRVGDIGTELQPVVSEALDFAETQHAFIFLTNKESKRLLCVAASGAKRDDLQATILRGDGTLGGWGAPLAHSSEWFGSGPSDRETMASLGIERTLILPLRASGEQVGVLGVAEPRQGTAFGQDAIRLMTHLASQASLIIERTHDSQPGSEQYDYEALIQASPLGIGVLTISGDIQECNPALVSLLTRSSRSLAGRSLVEFLTPNDGRRLGPILEEVVITGQNRQLDVRTRSDQGSHRHVRISLSMARITDDQDGSLIVLMEDVSPLKILEQERVDYLRELRVKHDQLRELDELKSRFVSNVSHELRTPLAVIKLYATLARKGRPDKQLHYLQTIEQETHRLETMVENILDLTRMDRQALRISPEWVSAEEIISQVMQVYEETAEKRGVELRNHLQDALPPLWADKNHLIQMLTNLIDNALKYTPRGEQVWVAAREVGSDSKRMLEIAVGDSGLGIPDDEQEKVFDRFYRGSNNTPGSTGTGLGLAIVQELMTQHKGTVTLKSQVGEGSVLALQFPLSGPEDAPEAQQDT
jgi:PAS domain S-box-containing protein